MSEVHDEPEPRASRGADRGVERALEHANKIVNIAAALSNSREAGTIFFVGFVVLRTAIAGDSESLFFSEVFQRSRRIETRKRENLSSSGRRIPPNRYSVRNSNKRNCSGAFGIKRKAIRWGIFVSGIEAAKCPETSNITTPARQYRPSLRAFPNLQVFLLPGRLPPLPFRRPGVF